MEKHLSRKEIINLAQKEPFAPNSHIESCKDCRLLFSLLREHFVIGMAPLQDAPDALINKAKSLIKSNKIRKRVPINLARLTFDSWSISQPVGVRDESGVDSRRVRFVDENIVIDIRAEQQKEGWTFVAQINDDSQEADGDILEVGKKKLHVDADGLCQWTSKNPPKTISVHTAKRIIKIPELLWTHPE